MTGALPPVASTPRAAYAADVDLVTRAVVASSLVGSAVVHGTVAGEHFGEWVPAGIFFVALQVVEVALALAAVYAWSRRAALAVVVTGLATLSIWLVSRTVGMPIGPPDFQVPEAVGVPDLACGVLEGMSVLAAIAALPLLRSRRSARATSPTGTAGPTGTTPRSRLGVVLAGTLVWAAVVLTAWGGVPSLSGSTHLHGDASATSTR
jgi:hypothetical protein